MSYIKSLNDAELVALVKSGDKLAYEEIYSRYWHVLYRHAIKMVRNDEDATDVVQEIFVNFWLKAANIRINSSLSYYLHSCVRFHVLNLISRDKIKTTYLSTLHDRYEKGASVTDEAFMEKELISIIEQEISSLPLKMRKVFKLSREKELSYKEIASELAISEGTVKKQMYNALKILRSKLSSFFFLMAGLLLMRFL